jgi:hypothetical protein
MTIKEQIDPAVESLDRALVNRSSAISLTECEVSFHLTMLSARPR